VRVHHFIPVAACVVLIDRRTDDDRQEVARRVRIYADRAQRGCDVFTGRKRRGRGRKA